MWPMNISYISSCWLFKCTFAIADKHDFILRCLYVIITASQFHACKYSLVFVQVNNSNLIITSFLKKILRNRIRTRYDCRHLVAFFADCINCFSWPTWTTTRKVNDTRTDVTIMPWYAMLRCTTTFSYVFKMIETYSYNSITSIVRYSEKRKFC